MAKYAVYNILHRLSDDTQLKRLSLLFDKIYTGWYKVDIAGNDLFDESSPQIKKILTELHAPEIKLFNYLTEHGIIQDTNTIPKAPINKEHLPIIKDTERIYNDLVIPQINVPGKLDNNFGELIDHLADNTTRLDTISLSSQIIGDFFPILRTPPPISEGNKKENVVRLLLNNIPEPTPDAPWEQIIDFRSDTETRIKYLALINWANEMANSSLSINEIQEKYEYLYLQYLDAYKAHKIKSNFGVLEIFTALGISLASGNVAAIPTIVSNFFKLGTYTFSYLKDEKSLPGRELSYIYHSKLEFEK